MRFIASVYQTSTENFKVPFLVPCAGYFQNISVMFRLSTEVDQWHVAFGKVNSENFSNELSPSNGWSYVRSKSDDSNFRVDWADAALEDASTAVIRCLHHAFRSKKLYVKSDEMYMIAFDAPSAVGVTMVVMAEFVPHPNAHYKQTWTTNSIAADSDHNKGIMIPQAVKNAILRVYGHVDTATGEHGTLQLRIADRDDPDVDSASFLTGFGVFDTGYGSVSGDTIASNNVFEVMIGQPNNQGGSNQIDMTFPVRKIIHEGDAITYDLLQDAATFSAGDVDLRFTIEGKAFQKNRSAMRSYFVEGGRIIKYIHPPGTRN